MPPVTFPNLQNLSHLYKIYSSKASEEYRAIIELQYLVKATFDDPKVGNRLYSLLPEADIITLEDFRNQSPRIVFGSDDHGELAVRDVFAILTTFNERLNQPDLYVHPGSTRHQEQKVLGINQEQVERAIAVVNDPDLERLVGRELANSYRSVAEGKSKALYLDDIYFVRRDLLDNLKDLNERKSQLTISDFDKFIDALNQGNVKGLPDFLKHQIDAFLKELSKEEQSKLMELIYEKSRVRPSVTLICISLDSLESIGRNFKDNALSEELINILGLMFRSDYVQRTQTARVSMINFITTSELTKNHPKTKDLIKALYSEGLLSDYYRKKLSSFLVAH